MTSEGIDKEGSEPRALTTTVVVDYRERASGIADLLREQGDVRVCVEPLKVGDYLIDDRVVVERKTLDDFALSVIDARLFRQAARLMNSRWRPAILLEGHKRSGTMSRNAFTGALITLTLIYDIPVLRSKDAAESARVLLYCVRQMSDRSPRRFGTARVKPKRPEWQRLSVLTSLPRIGEQTARRLLETFGTVEGCLSASEEALCAVPGIGVKTARELRRIVGE